MTNARFRCRLGRQERFMVFDGLEVGGRGGSCLFGYRRFVAAEAIKRGRKQQGLPVSTILMAAVTSLL
eukprot:scaffold1843_cov143-Skeletonema_menzelii.AAC.8